MNPNNTSDTPEASPRSRYHTGNGSYIQTHPTNCSAIKAPLLYADSWKTFVTGGLLMAFVWTIIPLFIIAAYCAELVEADVTNRRQTIELLDFSHTIKDSVRGLSVAALIGIPAAAGWAVFSTLFSAHSTANGFVIFSDLFLGMSLLATVSMTAIALYTAPAVFIESVRMDSAVGAVNVQLKNTLLSTEYFLTWVLSAVLFSGAISVWAGLIFIPVAGWVAGPAIVFYSICVIAVLLTRASDDTRTGPGGQRRDSMRVQNEH